LLKTGHLRSADLDIATNSRCLLAGLQTKHDRIDKRRATGNARLALSREGERLKHHWRSSFHLHLSFVPAVSKRPGPSFWG
jgi:hypothetical protein